MLIRTLTALTFIAALPLGAMAQPAVPAVPARPGAAAPPASSPAAPAPAPAPVNAADLPPTTDAAPVATAPAAPVYAPAPTVTRASPAVTGAPPAPASASDDPPTSGAPIATASATPPAADAAPTTDAAAATTAVPTAQSLQTVTKNSPLTPEGNARFLATYATMPGVKTLTGGVMYRPLVVGKGTITPISRMDTVTVSYRGWLINGTSFDNSPPGSPRTFQLNGLIPGWREALLKMKVGDLWEVVVPAEQAYGEEGRDGRIPPNQTLVFVISLAKIEYAG